MNINSIKLLKKYIIKTYILFYILFIISGLFSFLKLPQYLQIIMQYICAWTSTIVFIIQFKNIYPNSTIWNYIKIQFKKTKNSSFIISSIIQIIIAIIAITCVKYFNINKSNSLKFVEIKMLPKLFILNILYGPMGEEIGWRSYVLNELQKRRSPLVSSIIVGLLWSLWHFPLWFLSGYKYLELLVYSIFFIISLIALSILQTYFYNRSKNLFIAIWIHFVFNFSMQIVIINGLSFLIFNSILYVIAIIILIFIKKDKMLKN